MTARIETDTRRLLTTRELCARLGITAARFYRSRAALEARHGFPARVPGFNLYDPAAIDAWLDGLTPALCPDSPAIAIDWSALLAANAERLAAEDIR